MPACCWIFCYSYTTINVWVISCVWKRMVAIEDETNLFLQQIDEPLNEPESWDRVLQVTRYRVLQSVVTNGVCRTHTLDGNVTQPPYWMLGLPWYTLYHYIYTLDAAMHVVILLLYIIIINTNNNIRTNNITAIVVSFFPIMNIYTTTICKK